MTGPLAEDGLPRLREIIERDSIFTTKALGQNFLLDLNLTRRIARAGGPLDGVHVLEIGPGPGGLTRALLSEGAGHVTVIERDPRCLPALEEIAAHHPGRLTVVEGDALKLDPAAILPADGTGRIVANLPYNIGTELLLRWLSATLMFQREVAERIVAPPATSAYGRLGVLCGWRTHADIVFDVPPQAFFPPPKVMSSVVRLEPRAAEGDLAPSALETVTRHAFGQRRKMLRQSLKAIGGETLLDQAGIDPQRRAETLSVAEFTELARLYALAPSRSS